MSARPCSASLVDAWEDANAMNAGSTARCVTNTTVSCAPAPNAASRKSSAWSSWDDASARSDARASRRAASTERAASSAVADPPAAVPRAQRPTSALTLSRASAHSASTSWRDVSAVPLARAYAAAWAAFVQMRSAAACAAVWGPRSSSVASSTSRPARSSASPRDWASCTRCSSASRRRFTRAMRSSKGAPVARARIFSPAAPARIWSTL